jgi:hypothetical protein
MGTWMNDIEENYDFLKSDEAKQIFLNLEKIEYVEKEEILDEEDFKEWRNSLLLNDEKQSLVDHLVTLGWGMQKGMESSEEKNNNKDLLLTLKLKEEIDPDYIYENWLYEKEKMFHKMKLEELTNDDFSYIEFFEEYEA